jgi:hypothetical protein
MVSFRVRDPCHRRHGIVQAVHPASPGRRIRGEAAEHAQRAVVSLERLQQHGGGLAGGKEGSGLPRTALEVTDVAGCQSQEVWDGPTG